MLGLKFWKNGKPCGVSLGEESVRVMYLKDSRKQVTEAQRPRRLVVVINPNSGKKQGEKIYRRHVQPLFALCGIHTRVNVTRAAKEARDILQTIDLEDVDGVVTVGGDGLYCEVMTGLLMRTQADLGVNVHDPEVKAAPSRLPIGLIPAGTSSMMVQYLHGTRDVTTAALHVVLGRGVASNAVSVHQGARLSAYAGLVLGFGLQGDIMADCERFRWMGERRYDVIPIRTVLSRRCHEVQVEYADLESRQRRRTSATLYGVDTYVVAKEEAAGHVTAAPPGKESVPVICGEELGHSESGPDQQGCGCARAVLGKTGHASSCPRDPRQQPTRSGTKQEEEEEEEEEPGKMMISGDPLTLEEAGRSSSTSSSSSSRNPSWCRDKPRCRRDPGLTNVFGAEAMTVYMTHKCPLGRHVQQLAKLKDNASGIFDYDFVQKARVESYTVRLPEAATTWEAGVKVLKDPLKVNCDGEVLRITRPEFHVRLHRHAIRLYGEAIE